MSTQRISRRQLLTGAGAAALSIPFINLGRAWADEQPNIVFILTDDQRYDAMSCAGHPFLRTPNLDRLAAEGVRFGNAFVTIALCAPSRACFLTGQYAHSHGIKDNKTHLDDSTITFPRVLHDAGYDTAFMGKWHMDGQEGPRPGVNRWVSFKGQGEYWPSALNVDGRMTNVAGHMTDVLTDFAVDWLKQPRKSPFMLYLSHKSVHGPFTPPIRHSKLYSDAKVPRPETMGKDYEGQPKWLENAQGWNLGTRKADPEAHARFVRNYNRCIVGIDESVGRVLSTLQDIGALDNTVVVFAGDNGYFQGEHDLRDKRAMYEESIRIPLLMRYPRLVRPAKLENRMVLHIDLCPTLLDLAGVKVPETVQGRSWKPLLKGKASDWRRDFLYEYWEEKPFPIPTIRGVRTDRWKYIEYPEIDDTSELYDLKNDPIETKNLINSPSAAATLADMRARLARLLKETA